MRSIKKSIIFPYLVAILFCLIVSCKEKNLVQYEDGKQLLTLNFLKANGDSLGDIRIINELPDSGQVNTEFVAKIYINRSDLQIVNAFIDCSFAARPAVDTLNGTVIGCTKRLVVQNDTIYVGFVPTGQGLHDFPEITILTLDDAKIYRTFQYSFDYRIY